MVYTCAAVDCGHACHKNNNSKKAFYQFPKDPERRKRWIAAIGGKNSMLRSSTRLCSAHFISGLIDPICDTNSAISFAIIAGYFY